MLHEPVSKDSWGGITMSEWIDVAYTLPELHASVLVCSANGEVSIGRRVQGRVFVDLIGRERLYTVTHWMPLPEPIGETGDLL